MQSDERLKIMQKRHASIAKLQLDLANARQSEIVAKATVKDTECQLLAMLARQGEDAQLLCRSLGVNL